MGCATARKGDREKEGPSPVGPFLCPVAAAVESKMGRVEPLDSSSVSVNEDELQEWELQANIGCCQKCREDVAEYLTGVEGVESVDLYPDMRKVVVTGNVDPDVLLLEVQKVKKKARILTRGASNNLSTVGDEQGRNNKEDDKKKKKKQSGHAEMPLKEEQEKAKTFHEVNIREEMRLGTSVSGGEKGEKWRTFLTDGGTTDGQRERRRTDRRMQLMGTATDGPEDAVDGDGDRRKKQRIHRRRQPMATATTGGGSGDW
ncbi:hypothetical protein EJ110_NYTH12294 [Nymphaea thermarum]|nr:hypothetical protein EJ110_NYTH12294 [Nymphaea thermarum]